KMINETVSGFFEKTFEVKGTRDLFFDHVRRSCRENKTMNLLLLLDELILNIIKKYGLVNICNMIGREESIRICKWFFDLSPDFYPWIEYEWTSEQFTFEYKGETHVLWDGFT
ncbi:17930_t:CDS:1, partial [Racocetra persica]